MKTNTTRATTHAWWVSSLPELDDLCPLQLILGQGRLAVGAPEPTSQQKVILAEPWNRRYARLLDAQTAHEQQMAGVVGAGPSMANEAASVAQGIDAAEIAKAAWDEAWRIAFSEGMSAGHPLGSSYLDRETEWADSAVVARLAQAAPPAAPVQGDERKLFEARGYKSAIDGDFIRDGDGQYANRTIQHRWEAWRERARIARGCQYIDCADDFGCAGCAAPAAPASTCTRCDYIGKCDCEIGAALAAPAGDALTDERELDLYDEIECDLPALFGRASLEGHEAGQRLAKQVQEKMCRARAQYAAPAAYIQGDQLAHALKGAHLCRVEAKHRDGFGMVPIWTSPALSSVSESQIRAAITNEIGFDWFVGETQTVNADDLMRVAREVLALAAPANPHPEAGKPDHYLEVGCGKECIPCLVRGRHNWAGRAMKAEGDTLRIDYLAGIDPHQVREIALAAENDHCGDLRSAIDAMSREQSQGRDREGGAGE